MGFININDYERIRPVAGCALRTPYGEHLMLSYLEIEEGHEIPMHSHPHEQGGILLKGTLDLTIGDETRRVQPGAMYLIPAHVPHRAVAVGGPAVVLDCFSPIREDYAAQTNQYIPQADASRSARPQRS